MFEWIFSLDFGGQVFEFQLEHKVFHKDFVSFSILRKAVIQFLAQSTGFFFPNLPQSTIYIN